MDFARLLSTPASILAGIHRISLTVARSVRRSSSSEPRGMEDWQSRRRVRRKGERGKDETLAGSEGG